MKGSVFSVMLLVAGTCIGGGILVLPVATSLAGFFPSLGFMFVCAVFMAITGLLFVEVNLWTGPGTHIITMANRFLGRWGKLIAGILYLFISYASLIAYIDGGGALFAWGIAIPKVYGCLIFTALFAAVILVGRHFLGRVNDILFGAMIIAYALLITGGAGEVQVVNLVRQDWFQGFSALPILLTIFSYQAIVPSVVTYLKGNAKDLRVAILGGAFLAFVVYAVWQWLILGVVPLEGEHALREKLVEGVAATESFRFYAQQKWISVTSEFFAFFAIVTSFLGIGLGLFDFLSDGLKVKEKGWNRFWLVLLVVAPALIFALYYKRAFLEALDATGGFGDAILNGIIPALMVWSGRYYHKMKSTLPVWGGRVTLVLVILFSLFVFGVEVVERIHPITPVDDVRAVPIGG